ncbi:bifunctional methylenetetrahydrofolate dehydrogenase/methenyltetrahydrofolate cyclohydrolase [Candidatus Shapirobacteria bacterium CG06_land_8_20_14_3_00_40_12]|uniref:Bifunctional protein FolD n=2 Tax=Candidatus Shapironibacteriota TaxID=1752721 RepID=A0A2M7TRG0_9BACT|nr:MAG: bifunctional methylenetetrahydrofolate dehydrogenase/methenyltetrahydrofolate cyclohydrolase [Candidatus Shapirobacteria bacterium CG06_land_8_20_14_3_00_40_12]PIZ57833.1 MAG: bifunctional methylenetetrahydrofolate dehydrogenase/methenyltetrahydrofolate cyclohydrolase [Candidatus Shapirobacteria bacterium CG_4_10_14_0_2_um_filter_40_12]
MVLLDGKTLSEKILSDLRIKISKINKSINLDIILVGDDPSSLKYVALKQAKAESIGIGGRLHHFSVNQPPATIFSLIDSLNLDSSVTGFFVQLPLPENYDKNFIVNSINPNKDADGLNPTSGIIPAVDKGIIRLLEEYQISLSGKSVVIVNDSLLIGQPLKKELEKQGAIVTLCNQKTTNLKSITLTSDILISATGVKNLITGPMVKEGIVAIDVGGGDIDFTGISPKASYITTTFGGVGPMTVASLLENTYELVIKNGG